MSFQFLLIPVLLAFLLSGLQSAANTITQDPVSCGILLSKITNLTKSNSYVENLLFQIQRTEVRPQYIQNLTRLNQVEAYGHELTDEMIGEIRSAQSASGPKSQSVHRIQKALTSVSDFARIPFEVQWRIAEIIFRGTHHEEFRLYQSTRHFIRYVLLINFVIDTSRADQLKRDVEIASASLRMLTENQNIKNVHLVRAVSSPLVDFHSLEALEAFGQMRRAALAGLEKVPLVEIRNPRRLPEVRNFLISIREFLHRHSQKRADPLGLGIISSQIELSGIFADSDFYGGLGITDKQELINLVLAAMMSPHQNFNEAAEIHVSDILERQHREVLQQLQREIMMLDSIFRY